MADVFLTFLRLGLTSFGGPIAHLAYFRREFVERRGWLDERLFANLVAFCSILPGPTSSQVGLMVGLIRAGPGGAFAAWVGFTLPSAVALTLFAIAIGSFEAGGAQPWLAGMLAGLGAAATAIVAQAVVAMARTHCSDRRTQTIAAGAAVAALALAPTPVWQWIPIAGGALSGVFLLRAFNPTHEPQTPLFRMPTAVCATAGALFVVLCSAATVAAGKSPAGNFIATFVRAGSLVFGGGHVVLPLLQSLVRAGLVTGRDFYAGYGLTQAMPGPLFTFAAFLGTANRSPLHGVAGAVAATVTIFVPSFLLVFALWPVLTSLHTSRTAAAALRGANAGVVGLLGALLYSPLLLGLGTSSWRLTIAVLTFTLVAIWKLPPWLAVLAGAATGIACGTAGLR